MKLIDRYLLSDAKEAKVCFHCKNAPALPRKGVCQKCSKELEQWRNKKNKNKSL